MKINPNLLPAPAPPRIETVRVAIPDVGEFVMHLRRPAFSELLKVQEEIRARAAEWEKTGNWYPCNPPVQPSESLWQAVMAALAFQVAEDGSELPAEDRYLEPELVPLVGRIPAIYMELNAAMTVLFNEAQSELGNGSEAGAA